MEFSLAIVDESSLLGELERFQIGRLVWLRLATVEQRVRSVNVRVSKKR